MEKYIIIFNKCIFYYGFSMTSESYKYNLIFMGRYLTEQFSQSLFVWNPAHKWNSLPKDITAAFKQAQIKPIVLQIVTKKLITIIKYLTKCNGVIILASCIYWLYFVIGVFKLSIFWKEILIY